MRENEPWIGHVHVRPMEGENPFGEGRKGAFTHAVALSNDMVGYQDQIRQALISYNLYPVEFKDVSRASDYRKEGRIPSDLEDLIESLSEDDSVQFDVFDTYKNENA